MAQVNRLFFDEEVVEVRIDELIQLLLVAQRIRRSRFQLPRTLSRGVRSNFKFVYKLEIRSDRVDKPALAV
jgi:hypothetical protein